MKPTPSENIGSVDMLHILEQGYKVRMVLTRKHHSQVVDNPSDLKRVEKLIQKERRT